MAQVSIDDIQQDLSTYLQRVEAGETLVIIVSVHWENKRYIASYLIICGSSEGGEVSAENAWQQRVR